MQNVVVISYNLTFFCRFDVHFLFFNLNFVENHTYSQKFFNPKYPARRKKNILSSSDLKCPVFCMWYSLINWLLSVCQTLMQGFCFRFCLGGQDSHGCLRSPTACVPHSPREAETLVPPWWRSQE